MSTLLIPFDFFLLFDHLFFPALILKNLPSMIQKPIYSVRIYVGNGFYPGQK